ncbi:MAG TPA: S8 family serine peptidase, partial [Nitrospirota bacterium]
MTIRALNYIIAIAVFLLIAAVSLSPAHAVTPVKSGKAATEGRIGLVNFPFDTASGEPSVPQNLKGRPGPTGRPGYVIVRFTGKDNAGARKRLTRKGIRFFGYVPVDAFLAKAPYGRRAALASDPDVAAVFDYRPAYRLEGKLLGQVGRGETGTRKLVVLVFDGEELAQVEREIEGLGGSSEVYSDTDGVNGKALKAHIDASRIPELASVEGVQWVEEETVPVLHNDASDSVLGADYAWAEQTPLTGTGQVAAICDTGLDTGNTSTIHLDFRGNASDGLPKIKQAFAYGRPDDWSDPHGHGTHTAGSLTGFGAKSDELSPGTFVRGMAYGARLVFQSIGVDAAGAINAPNLNSYLFPDAYGAGARVHSNSWGFSGTAGSYTYTAVLADTYTWDHKDFTVLFSAGNDGVDVNPADGVIDMGSVASPATAKNVISVGASENNRPSITTTWGTAAPGLYRPPILNDKMADNTSGMAAFSGRGPCLDGRIKPDVVAPGTYVLSTRSSASANYITPASSWGYSSALDPYYGFKSGTSMSCPLTAGVATLVREFLAGAGSASPSSALVKGLMIAGAADMTPGQYSGADNDVTARPDNNQGWGRVDVKGSLYPAPPGRMLYDDNAQGLSTGVSKSYTFTVSDASVPVRVNLVWTDYPGTSGASPNIVNDLDLTVAAPDGSVY